MSIWIDDNLLSKQHELQEYVDKLQEVVPFEPNFEILQTVALTCRDISKELEELGRYFWKRAFEYAVSFEDPTIREEKKDETG